MPLYPFLTPRRAAVAASPRALYASVWRALSAPSPPLSTSQVRLFSDAQQDRTKPKPMHLSQRFALVAPALRAFHAAAGHFVVPFNLIIPEKDHAGGPIRIHGRIADARLVDWPDEARGLNVENTIRRFLSDNAHRRLYPEVDAALQEIGFPVHVDWKEYVWDRQRLAALRVFKKLHGHCLVPITPSLQVPRGDERWPVETWGYQLGITVNSIRNGQYPLLPGQLNQLEALGFSWDVLDTLWATKLLPALEAYSLVYGDCRVTRSFTVPSEAPWPQTAWGLRLGYTVNDIRRGEYEVQVARDRAKLKQLGFVWDCIKDRWETFLLPAFETYYALYGDCNVKRHFRVPKKEPWPKATWGLQLGFAVNNIRRDGTFAYYRDRDAERCRAIQLDEALGLK